MTLSTHLLQRPGDGVPLVVLALGRQFLQPLYHHVSSFVVLLPRRVEPLERICEIRQRRTDLEASNILLFVKDHRNLSFYQPAC